MNTYQDETPLRISPDKPTYNVGKHKCQGTFKSDGDKLLTC